MAILAVTGMRAEAALLPPGLRVLVSGGDPARLRALLAAADGDVTAVLSFGIAGGLDPALTPGSVVVAGKVVAGESADACDAALADAIAARLAPSARRGMLAGIETPLLRPADKQALFAQTAALAADMESHVAAAYAVERGLPFVAVRVVCDAACRALPAFAATALKPDGTSDLSTVIRGLARDPAAISGLVRLARDSRTALATLARIAPAVAAALSP
jgi:hopanoid-associated phosphorylase